MATKTQEDKYLEYQVEEFTRDMDYMLHTIGNYIIRAQGWKNSRYAMKFFNQIKEVKTVLEKAEKFKI